jgi:hypothetical protein
MPGLPDIVRITAESAERAKTQPLLPWGTVGAALVLAGFAGYGVLFWLRRQRNAFRISPSEVARLLEGNDPPAILDVREASSYERSPMRIPRSLRVTLEEIDAGGKRPDVDEKRLVVAYCS